MRLSFTNNLSFTLSRPRGAAWMIFAFAAALLSSCANNAGGGATENVALGANSTGYYNNNIQADGSTIENGYDCAEKPNVMPGATSDAIFTDEWTVCTNTQNTSDIEIQGRGSETQVCIFPVNVLNGIASAMTSYKCVAPQNQTAYASFPGITYNAAYIVEYSDVLQMQQCLALGSYNVTCPAYSYGQFRN
ncbi:MAG: hypothetical protein P4M08_06575 [Oligoflexia bacterium]|nr:hypothetical protein [Oligoflexia bacterium]